MFDYNTDEQDGGHIFDTIEQTITDLQADIANDIHEGNQVLDTEMGGENAHKKRSLKEVFRDDVLGRRNK